MLANGDTVERPVGWVSVPRSRRHSGVPQL